jgi:hypothetical protein
MQQASSAPNRPRRSGRNWRGDLLLTTGVTVLCAVLLVDTPLNPLFWLGGLGNGLDPSVYGIQARDAQKERFLARIPPDAPTAASTFIAAHLTNRATLYLLRYPDEANGPERLPKLLPQVDYAVADSLFDFFLPIDGGYAGGLDGDRAAIGLLLQDPNFGLINTSDGLLLFQRNAGAASLKNEIARQPDDQAPALARYGSAIELVRASAIQTEPGRLRMSFTWRLTGGFGNGQYVAVTRVRGQSERFVHLPSYALQPAWEWRAGQLFQETFEVEVPTDLAPGSYAIQTGWYDLSSPYAYATDQRSRMPNSDEVTVGSVTIQR